MLLSLLHMTSSTSKAEVFSLTLEERHGFCLLPTHMLVAGAERGDGLTAPMVHGQDELTLQG